MVGSGRTIAPQGAVGVVAVAVAVAVARGEAGPWLRGDARGCGDGGRAWGCGFAAPFKR